MGTKDTKGMTYYISGNILRNDLGWIEIYLSYTTLNNMMNDWDLVLELEHLIYSL